MRDLESNNPLSRLIAIGIIVILTLITYSNIYSNKFLWDDEFLIDENQYIMSYENIGKIFSTSSTAGFGTSDSFYRPMQMLTYMIAYSVGGHDEVNDEGHKLLKKRVWPFHLLNVLLHLFNAVLIFLLVLALFEDESLAFLSSSLWAVHPVHTEAITYMSGTADPLSVVFVLSSCLLYLNFRKSKKIALLAYSVFCFPLALLSKEAVIILPGLVMTIDFIRSKDRWWPQTYRWSLPYWLIAFGYLYLRKTILDFDKTYQFYDTANIYTENMQYRAYTFLATLPEYVKFLIYPVDLHMERKFPVFVNFTSTPVLIGFAIFMMGLIGLLWNRNTRKPILSFAFLWFFIAFVPMCGILLPVNSFLLEHWLYLTSIGLFVLMAAGLKRVLDLRLAVYGLQYIPVIAMIVCLMALTFVRNRDWRDPLTFYGNILKYNEGTARVHNNIAMAFADNRDYDQASVHYLKAIELAGDLYPQPHYNLARIYIRKKDYETAKRHLLRSLEINPNFHFAKNLLLQLDSFLQNQQPPPTE